MIDCTINVKARLVKDDSWRGDRCFIMWPGAVIETEYPMDYVELMFGISRDLLTRHKIS